MTAAYEYARLMEAANVVLAWSAAVGLASGLLGAARGRWGLAWFYGLLEVLLWIMKKSP